MDLSERRLANEKSDQGTCRRNKQDRPERCFFFRTMGRGSHRIRRQAENDSANQVCESSKADVQQRVSRVWRSIHAGDLEVEGNLQELLRLGIIVQFDEKTFSLLQKIRLLPFGLKTMDTAVWARGNIAYHYDLTPGIFLSFPGREPHVFLRLFQK